MLVDKIKSPSKLYDCIGYFISILFYFLLFTFNVVIITVGVTVIVVYIFSTRVYVFIVYTSGRHVFTVIVYFSRLSGIHCYYLHVQYTRIIVVVLVWRI